jgi:hypothetical protein
MVRNPNVRRCLNCGAISAVPSADGKCVTCKTVYGEGASLEQLDPEEPIGADGKNIPPGSVADVEDSETGVITQPKARRRTPPQSPAAQGTEQLPAGPPSAAAPSPQSELTLRYVKLGRDLEGPARVLLKAALNARDNAKAGKKPSATWANSKEAQAAIDSLGSALATPAEQKRRRFDAAFNKSRELQEAGKPEEAYDLLASVFEG